MPLGQVTYGRRCVGEPLYRRATGCTIVSVYKDPLRQTPADGDVVVADLEHEGTAENAALFHGHRLSGVEPQLTQPLADVKPPFYAPDPYAGPRQDV